MKSDCLRQRSWAFTMVELLVVMGTISVLIAFLLPAAARAQRQSRAVACKAQLENIGSAFQMYLNENSSRYPPAPALPGVPAGSTDSIIDYLGRYSGAAADVYHCPADSDLFPQTGCSYFYNLELGITRLTDSTFFRLYGSSSKVPVLWDAGNFHGGVVPYNWLFADGHVDQFLADNATVLQGQN